MEGLMTSVAEIMSTLKPVFEGVRDRKEINQIKPIDAQIFQLFKALNNNRTSNESSLFENFVIVNTHLSSALNLSDFKTCLGCSPKAANLIVKYLKLKQNFDKLDVLFPTIERIKATSDCILRQVSLDSLQLAGFVVTIKNSPVWYALSPDDQFLNSQVYDLKEFCSDSNVVPTRLQEIEKTNQHLLDKWNEKSFSVPWMFGTLDLTIGKLPSLSAEELASIAYRLPISAYALLSESQMMSLNFNQFSGPMLDRMIGGDGTNKDIIRRLKLLNKEQSEIYLKKSSGCYFSFFSDTFYKMLSISNFTEAQILLLFDASRNKENAIHHLQLVSPQEIFKGFHLLPGNLARMLSDFQLALLDYPALSKEQIGDLFDAAHFKDKEEHRKRVQLIPERFVNDVIKTNNCIVPYLSLNQYEVLNVLNLDLETVQKIFPSFAISSIHKGSWQTFDTSGNGVQYKFEIVENGVFSVKRYFQDELDELMENKRKSCLIMAKNFSSYQLKSMLPLMELEVRELIKLNS